MGLLGISAARFDDMRTFACSDKGLAVAFLPGIGKVWEREWTPKDPDNSRWILIRDLQEPSPGPSGDTTQED